MGQAVTHAALLAELLSSMVDGNDLAQAVRATLAVLEEDPVATGGRFRGDLLRALMRVGGRHWSAHPGDYDRYRAALRNAALLRRGLVEPANMEFWTPLEVPRR